MKKHKTSKLILIKKHLSVVFLMMVSLGVYAQDNPQDTIQYRKLPIIVKLGNQTIGLPYQNFFADFNPSGSLGTELIYSNRKKINLGQSFTLGFFSNDFIGNTFYLSSDFLVRTKISKSFYFDFTIGLGLMDQFQARDYYTYEAEKQKYVPQKDNGQKSVFLESGMSIGYDLSNKYNLPISIKTSYNFLMQNPYFDLPAFPIMPHSTLEFGVAIKLKK